MRPDAVIHSSLCPDPETRMVFGPTVKPGDIVGAGRDVGEAQWYSHAEQCWTIRTEDGSEVRIGAERISFVSWRS